MNSLLLFIAYLLLSNPLVVHLSQRIVGNNDVANLILRTVILVLLLKLFPHKSSYDKAGSHLAYLNKIRFGRNTLF